MSSEAFRERILAADTPALQSELRVIKSEVVVETAMATVLMGAGISEYWLTGDASAGRWAVAGVAMYLISRFERNQGNHIEQELGFRTPPTSDPEQIS